MHHFSGGADFLFTVWGPPLGFSALRCVGWHFVLACPAITAVEKQSRVGHVAAGSQESGYRKCVQEWINACECAKPLNDEL